MESVRNLARAENRNLSDVVNELLREGLEKHSRKEGPSEFDLPSYSMGPARVNLADREALEAAMES